MNIFNVFDVLALSEVGKGRVGEREEARRKDANGEKRDEKRGNAI